MNMQISGKVKPTIAYSGGTCHNVYIYKPLHFFVAQQDECHQLLMHDLMHQKRQRSFHPLKVRYSQLGEYQYFLLPSSRPYWQQTLWDKEGNPIAWILNQN